MTHWLDKAAELLTAKTDGLRALAIQAGGDPRTFYRGVSLSGVDISGRDLRGMEIMLTPTTIADDHTQVDPQYQEQLAAIIKPL